MLSKKEKRMVENSITLIPGLIRGCISVNEGIVGLGYEDLYQEACVALCKAAMTYTGEAAFSTYARTVIKNHLISQCRAAVSRYSHERPPDDWDKWQSELEDIPAHEESDRELRELLSNVEGCTSAERQGIDALIMRAQGYSCSEIGRLFSLTGKLVSKRIAGAKKKLQNVSDLIRA